MEMSADAPAAAETRVITGRYRLLSKIGQGGMGTVWRAYDEFLGRTVAVKEIDLPRLADFDQGELRERALREARAAARLTHPNVVVVHDVVVEDGNPWIVMALVEAESLADALRSKGPLPPARVAEIGLAVLSALETAHAAGIVHRDVKPANVLLARDGRIVLTDFGIATLEGDPSLTSAGLLLGAPAYISPERAGGDRPGPASDLWSLGATLYSAVEGRPPYDQDSPMATLSALMTEDPPSPRAAGALTPALLGLLQRDPSRRPDTATTRRLLEDVLRSPYAQQTRMLTTAMPQPPGPPRMSERTQVVARPGADLDAAFTAQAPWPAQPPPAWAGGPPGRPLAAGPPPVGAAGPVPGPPPVPRWWATRIALTGAGFLAVLIALLSLPGLATWAHDHDVSRALTVAVDFAAWSPDRTAPGLRLVVAVLAAGVLLFAFGRSARAQPGGFGLLVTVWGIVAVSMAMTGLAVAPVEFGGVSRRLATVALDQAVVGATLGFIVGWLPALLVALTGRRPRSRTVPTQPARAGHPAAPATY